MTKHFTKISKYLTIWTALVVLAFFFGKVFDYQIFASLDKNPPNVPNCSVKIFAEQGDHAHYDYGVHGIPGRGNFEGSDDVYTLPDGNFLQCFCPVEGASGIQSVWWNVDRAGLSDTEIQEYLNQGWLFENGADWNLYNEKYLVNHSEFSCAMPTPTPTPENTPTPTVTPTPTPQDDPESSCSALSASPTDGTMPLTVKFTGSGFDEDGKIQRYKFDFGDASGSQPQVWEQDGSEASHRYENPGTYTATLSVKDSRGNWRDGNDDCKKTITVKNKPEVLSAKTPVELPKTGVPGLVGGGVLVSSTIGYYLYRRFKLA